MANTNGVHLNMFIQSLRLLAAPYEQQTQLLPIFVHLPDEIALIFDDTYALIKQPDNNSMIPARTEGALEQIEQLLDQMSENSDLWTMQALKSAAQWKEIRLLAGKVLAVLHEVKQPANLFWLQYIEGKPDESVQ